MKLMLPFVAALASASAALAQPAPAPSSPADTGVLPASPYNNYRDLNVGRTFPRDNQCFNGKFVSAANRVGDKVLLLQSKNSNVFRATLAAPCPAIDAATRLRVRSEGSYLVCNAGRGVIVATTPTGTKSCPVTQVRVLNEREVASLSTTPRR